MHQYTPSKPVYCVVVTDLLNDSYGQNVYNNNSERASEMLSLILSHLDSLVF